MDKSEVIKGYFQRTADDFDSIYSQGKNPVRKFIDFFFRRSMQQRFEATFRECGNLDGKSVLDVGCGSGRYCLEFAKRGAGKVLGVDFSENMLKLARGRAEQSNLRSCCRFIQADFLTYDFGEKFDFSLAIGVLEYLQAPQAVLDKMARLTRKRMIISLPVKWTLRSALRKLRLSLQGCPVYFYTRPKVAELLAGPWVKSYRMQRLDRDYLVIIDVK